MAEETAAAPKAPAEREKTIFDLMETDESVETMGVLLRYNSKIRILVARAGGANKKFERLVKELTKPHRKTIAAQTIDDETMTDILQEAYSRAVVLGWEGMTERDGKEIECTPPNIRSVFKRLPALWGDVRDFAANYANYLVLEEDAEATAKN